MKLLLDQGLPRGAPPLLRDIGIDTEHVSEIGYATAEDVEILAYARQKDQIVVTLDSDFHAILALSNASSPSVIRIRIEGLKAKPFVKLLRKVLSEWSEEFELGVMLTVQPGRVRIHYLPVLS